MPRVKRVQAMTALVTMTRVRSGLALLAMMLRTLTACAFFYVGVAENYHIPVVAQTLEQAVVVHSPALDVRFNRDLNIRK
jgi:hypothetical protein